MVTQQPGYPEYNRKISKGKGMMLMGVLGTPISDDVFISVATETEGWYYTETVYALYWLHYREHSFVSVTVSWNKHDA